MDGGRKNLRQRVLFLLDHLGLEARPTVCDVGANPVEMPIYTVLKRQHGCDVIGFEPQKAAFDDLVANAGPNETYFNAAVGRSGPATLHVYKSGGFTSLYKLRRASTTLLQRFMRQHDLEKLEAVQLTSLDEVEALPKIDFLKIDVQGAELEIISTARRALSNALVVVPEVRFYQMYEDEPSFADLDTELRNQGFMLHKLFSPTVSTLPNSVGHTMKRSRAASQWIDGDAVYVRNLEGMSTWPDEHLRKMALFAGTVFDSQDLAMMCLDHLAERHAIGADIPANYAKLIPDEFYKQTLAQAAE